MYFAGIELYSGMIPLTAEKTIFYFNMSKGNFSKIGTKNAAGVAITIIFAGSMIFCKSVPMFSWFTLNWTDCK